MDPAIQMGSKRHRIQCSNFGKCSRVWGQTPRDTVWFRPRCSSWFAISQLKAQLLGDSGPHSLRPIRSFSPGSSFFFHHDHVDGLQSIAAWLEFDLVGILKLFSLIWLSWRNVIGSLSSSSLSPFWFPFSTPVPGILIHSTSNSWFNRWFFFCWFALLYASRREFSFWLSRSRNQT